MEERKENTLEQDLQAMEKEAEALESRLQAA